VRVMTAVTKMQGRVGKAMMEVQVLEVPTTTVGVLPLLVVALVRWARDMAHYPDH
jgi:hypothetical protein